jgi:SAM-dependent methyltransferase
VKCRHCGATPSISFADLGTAPPSNAFLDAAALERAEVYLPLRVRVCPRCWLVQTEDFTHADALFDAGYAYFSGYSRSWLAHCERYVEAMVERFGLGPDSLVVEVAANDGSLLQRVQARGIPCLGVEPTASTASAAMARGLTVVQDFFGERLANKLLAEGRQADLVAANNVLAHVPDIVDFSRGFARLLRPSGVATFEFPHLRNLVEQTQFDTLYHEHFSYLSLGAVEAVFRTAGLDVFDVEELPTHGGSLRVYAQRADAGARSRAGRVDALIDRERAEGTFSEGYYRGFQARAERVKDDLLRFLLDARRDGLRVAGYGAAAKGNTLLNFAGVRRDLLPYVADRSPQKQGRFLPGSRIPIVSPEYLLSDRPDLVLVLPWNLRAELAEQLAAVRAYGGRLAVAVPSLEILP